MKVNTLQLVDSPLHNPGKMNFILGNSLGEIGSFIANLTTKNSKIVQRGTQSSLLRFFGATIFNNLHCRNIGTVKEHLFPWSLFSPQNSRNYYIIQFGEKPWKQGRLDSIIVPQAQPTCMVS